MFELVLLIPQNLTHVFLECAPSQEECPDVRLYLGPLRLQALECSVVDNVLFPLGAAEVGVCVVQPNDQPEAMIRQ